jgi:hypothetical protein
MIWACPAWGIPPSKFFGQIKKAAYPAKDERTRGTTFIARFAFARQLKRLNAANTAKACACVHPGSSKTTFRAFHQSPCSLRGFSLWAYARVLLFVTAFTEILYAMQGFFVKGGAKLCAQAP